MVYTIEMPQGGSCWISSKTVEELQRHLASGGHWELIFALMGSEDV